MCVLWGAGGSISGGKEQDGGHKEEDLGVIQKVTNGPSVVLCKEDGKGARGSRETLPRKTCRNLSAGVIHIVSMCFLLCPAAWQIP